MADEPTLDLRTNVERKSVRIDGVSYGMALESELTPEQQAVISEVLALTGRFFGVGQEIQEQQRHKFVKHTGEAVRALLPDLPADVLAKLGIVARVSVVAGFFEESSAQVTSGPQTGVMSFPRFSDSTRVRTPASG